MGDQPGSKYCFAAGDMGVECEDDMEFTPTGGPRPTEGPEGNNGATDEGEEGPNGVTNGPDGGDNGVTGGPDGGDNAGGVTGDGGATSAPRVVTWAFGMSEAVECVKPGTF